MNAQTAVATTEDKPLVILRDQLDRNAAELKRALPTHISPDKFQRTIITAVHQNPKLLDCSRQSLMLACMKAATDGLLPDGREAALVPFKRNVKGPNNKWSEVWEVVYMPMVYGLRKKVLQARDAKGEPVVSALEVGVVYRKEFEDQRFYYEVGKYPPLGHRPSLDLTTEDAADENIIGAYSIATMADGTKSYEFMRRFEIDKVREKSQTGATKDRYGKDRTPSGPWVEWFPEQCKKTVLRRHAKSLPQSGDLIIEAEDDEAGISAATLIGQTGDGTLITDESGDTIDTETGEVIDATASDAGPEHDTADNSDNDHDETDELGVTKDPAEAKAEEIIASYDNAKSLDALKKLYRQSAEHTEAMEKHLQDALEQAFDRNADRLRQPEPVK